MNAVTAIWKNGQIVLEGPVDWPEGRRLLVEPVTEASGMTEEEQGDDPESIERWIAEFNAIPPLIMSLQQEDAMLAWRQRMKEFNIEAVRRQMEEGIR